MKPIKDIFIVTTVLFIVSCNSQQPTFFRTYKCTENRHCQKTGHSGKSLDLENINHHSTLASCRLVCGKSGSLWPLPTLISHRANKYFYFDPRNIFFDTSEVPSTVTLLLNEMTEIFLKNVWSLCKNNCESSDQINIKIYFKIESENQNMTWETNEEYILDILKEGNDSKKILITSRTIYGARHGLETLSQLIAPTLTTTGERKLVMVNHASIKDKPAYPHRGLLIDTSRNFLPVEDILRTIDGLAASKMNVLHWHATDSQSFPIEIKSLPLMTLYGAYSTDKVYSVHDMTKVIRYAKVNGVRVIFELDTPSHAGAGWEWGPEYGLGNLAVCVNQQPWRNYCIQPPCGQLNPVNPNTLSTLKTIYKDVIDIFGADATLHLGGDELHINCWNSTPEITENMIENGMGLQTGDFLQLWSNFHKSQVNILKEITGNENAKLIIWSSHLTSPDVIQNHLNNNTFVIQTWVEAGMNLNNELLKLGYKLIISTKDAWYFDHGFWGTTKYYTWRDVYKNKIPNHKGVLGGEACMWGEYVVSGSLDSRVWPRAAAVAERLWTNSLKLGTAEVERRIMSQVERLQSRNISPEAIAPEWCEQHETQCF